MTKIPFRLLIATLFGVASILTSLFAAVPPVMTHQGRILQDNVNYDGAGYFKFALIDGASGEVLWPEHVAGDMGEPAEAVALTVHRGLYSLLLGDTELEGMPPLPADIFRRDDLRLRIWLSTNPEGPFERLEPDQRLAPAPYALAAGETAWASTYVQVPADGSPRENGEALRHAIESLPRLDKATPILIKLAPGEYDVGETPLRMNSHLTIEGSGAGLTRITGAGADEFANAAVIIGAPETHLRQLSVFNTGGARYSVGVIQDNGFPPLPNGSIGHPTPDLWTPGDILVAAHGGTEGNHRVLAHSGGEVPTAGAFKVEIDGIASPDYAWESCTGGSLNIEVADSSTGGDQYPTTTPGHKYVDDLVLRGPLTAGRKDGVGDPMEGFSRFKVEIEGVPELTDRLDLVSIDDLVIPAVEDREDEAGYMGYAPGDAHYGNITIRVQRHDDDDSFLQWWMEASRAGTVGDAARDITVTVMAPDERFTHQFTIKDAFPTRWDGGEYSPSSRDVSCETIVCKMGRVELAAIDSGGDEDDLPARAELYAWINDTANGADSRRIVTVKEIMKDGSDGKSFVYHDCFPTRYVFPAYSAAGAGNVYEEVAVKPIRLEID